MLLLTLVLAFAGHPYQESVPTLDDLRHALSDRPTGQWQTSSERWSRALPAEKIPAFEQHLEAAYPAEQDLNRSLRRRFVLSIPEDHSRQDETLWLSPHRLRLQFAVEGERPAWISIAASDEGESVRIQEIAGQEDRVVLSKTEDKYEAATGSSVALWDRERSRLLRILELAPTKTWMEGDALLLEFSGDRLRRALPMPAPGASPQESILWPPNDCVRPGGRLLVRYSIRPHRAVKSTYYDRLESGLLESTVAWKDEASALPTEVLIHSYVEGTTHRHTTEQALFSRKTSTVDTKSLELDIAPGTFVTDYRNGAKLQYRFGSDPQSIQEYEKEALMHAYLHMELLKELRGKAARSGHGPQSAATVRPSRYQHAGPLTASADPVDLGDVPVGVALPVYVLIQNDGEENVGLEVAEKSCTCLSVDFGDMRLDPEQTTWARIAVQPTDLGRGGGEVSVRPKGLDEALRFRIEWTGVPPSYALAPPFINFDTVEAGSEWEFDVIYWSSKKEEEAGEDADVEVEVALDFRGIEADAVPLSTHRDESGVRHELRIRFSCPETLEQYGFLDGSLAVGLRGLPESIQTIGVVANVSPRGATDWPDCLVVLERIGERSEVVCFPKDVKVTEVLLAEAESGSAPDLEARWLATKNGVEISTNASLLETDLTTGMGDVVLATNVGWVHVRALVVP